MNDHDPHANTTEASPTPAPYAHLLPNIFAPKQALGFPGATLKI